MSASQAEKRSLTETGQVGGSLPADRARPGHWVMIQAKREDRQVGIRGVRPSAFGLRAFVRGQAQPPVPNTEGRTPSAVSPGRCVSPPKGRRPPRTARPRPRCLRRSSAEDLGPGEQRHGRRVADEARLHQDGRPGRQAQQVEAAVVAGVIRADPHVRRAERPDQPLLNPLGKRASRPRPLKWRFRRRPPPFGAPRYGVAVDADEQVRGRLPDPRRSAAGGAGCCPPCARAGRRNPEPAGSRRDEGRRPASPPLPHAPRTGGAGVFPTVTGVDGDDDPLRHDRMARRRGVSRRRHLHPGPAASATSSPAGATASWRVPGFSSSTTRHTGGSELCCAIRTERTGVPSGNSGSLHLAQEDTSASIKIRGVLRG